VGRIAQRWQKVNPPNIDHPWLACQTKFLTLSLSWWKSALFGAAAIQISCKKNALLRLQAAFSAKLSYGLSRQRPMQPRLIAFNQVGHQKLIE
jgi:hypothetical protein